MNQRLIDADEVCKALKISKSTLYFYTSTKRIPFLKVGRHLRFLPQELDRWLKENTNKVVNY